MQTQALIAPRGRGRPRKAAVIPQFPGKVIPISSKPRLRVGAICEISRSSQPENIGARVEIIGISGNGLYQIRALDRPLSTRDGETGEPNTEKSWLAVHTASGLYRIGGRSHV